MDYATLRGAVRRRRSEEWQRIRAAGIENARLAAAVEGLPERRDRPAGMLALTGPLFGRPDWHLEVLSVWTEDRGTSPPGLYLPRPDGRRIYTSRTALARIVSGSMGLRKSTP